MKALTLIFVVLIALLQYPLWLGKGSWLRVWDLSHQISKQQEKNNALKARNDTLDAEVRDLKSGRAAIEERARSELGMVKQDEVFYQVLEGPMPVIVPPPTIAPEATKADIPIIVKVPAKNGTTTSAVPPASSPKTAVTPSPANNPVSNNKAQPEKSTLEKGRLSLQPINPVQQIEPAPANKPEEKSKTAEKPKEDKPKKAKADPLEAAKAVLKQQ